MNLRIVMLVLACLSTAASAQPVGRDPLEKSCGADSVHLLVLGSYHMNNPGLDEVNLDADDVLSPRRQAEIAALNRKLAAFRPTKVAVESDRSRSTANDRYRDWIGGRYTLGRSESEQVGMRVARAAGHSAIYPIDFPMTMSGLRYDEVEFKPKPKPSGSAPPQPRKPTEEELLLRRQTVGEYLLRINQPGWISADHAQYMELLFPDPDDAVLYGKADTLTNWYKRNVRMMANIARISAPRDRILLVVGSGHSAILRDFARSSTRFCLADTLHYLGG